MKIAFLTYKSGGNKGMKKQSKMRDKLNFIVGLVAIVLIAGAIVNYQPSNTQKEEVPTPAPTQEIVTTPEPTEAPAEQQSQSGTQQEYRSVNSLAAKHSTLKEAEWNETDNTIFLLVEGKEKGSAWISLEDNFDNIVDLVRNQGCNRYDRLDYFYYAYSSDGSFDTAVSFCVEKPLIEQIMNGTADKTGIKDKVTDLYINESFYSG